MAGISPGASIEDQVDSIPEGVSDTSTAVLADISAATASAFILGGDTAPIPGLTITDITDRRVVTSTCDTIVTAGRTGDGCTAAISWWRASLIS